MGSQKGFWSLVNLSEDILGNSLKFIKPNPLCKNTNLCYKRVFSISICIKGHYIKCSTFYCIFNKLTLELAAKHKKFKHLAHKITVPKCRLISTSKFMPE